MVDPQLARSGLMLLLVVIPMLAEARLSRRNEARLREQGAQEPAGDTYRVMSLAYPLAFLAIIGEGAIGPPVAGTWDLLTGLTLFGASKILKYSAIRALSTRWCFKVLVPPNSGHRSVRSVPVAAAPELRRRDRGNRGGSRRPWRLR